MLLLDSRTRQINGISVFPDHADPQQWYYLPLAPHLTTVRDDALDADVPQFLLVGFRGDAGTGGFLNFDCNVGAPDRQIDDLRREIANDESLADLPNLGPVPLVDGTVRLIMLGKQTGDGPGATPGVAGPQFVLKIDQAAKPALYGSNQAAFSVRLDQDGFTMMEQCLDGEIMPVAVIYSLDFLGLRPAYSIRLNIDWDRVQKHMDESFHAGFLFSSVDISKAVDELVDKRAIVLEADTFVPEGDESKGIIDRRDAALAQVRNMITDAFFQPSLPPYDPNKKDDFDKAMQVASTVGVVASAIASGGASTLLTASFNYKKTDYKRVDRKILNVNFSERVTIKKSIHPQGHLSGLFKVLRDTPLPRDRFVRHVDLNNDWFKKRRLKVATRADFAADEIASVNVRARYGDQPMNNILKDNTSSVDFEWLSQQQDGKLLRDVAVEYEVLFRNVDATERPLKLTSPSKTYDVENVEIVPRELFTISPIAIFAENFPWEDYSSVEVNCRYKDEANGINQRDFFRLTKEKPDAVWKMFVLDESKIGYEVQVIYRAMNNKDFDSGWKTSDETQITIRNPFPPKRLLQVVPSFKWAEVQQAFVDLRYEDPENDILEEASLEFAEGDATKSFAVKLKNPERKAIFYKVSILYKDGRLLDIPESVTNERRIIVSADMKGSRIIEVVPPDNFEQKRLKRVTVDMRFEDFMAGITVANSFVFDGPGHHEQFEYPYADEARNKYEWRATFLLQNGLQKMTDWQPSAATDLRINVP